MNISQLIHKLTFPIKKHNLVPCSQRVCLCLEYLDFGNRDHVNLYKHCMITALKNDYVPPPPPNVFRDRQKKTPYFNPNQENTPHP